MVSGDVRAAAGAQGEFYEMLRLFHGYWDRIDVVCPRVRQAKARTLFGRVHLHPAGRFCYPDLRAKLSQPFYSAQEVKRLVRERPYGLMTIHEVPPFHVSWAALRLARRFGLPVVSELHHVEGHPIAVDAASRLRRLVTGWWVRWIKDRVAAIRTVNAVEVPDYLQARGVSPERIKVLYSFDIDLDRFRPKKVERDVDFLFVGRLTANKGLDIFLKALALIRPRFPDLKVVVIGQGPKADEWRRLAGELGLGRAVEFIAWVKDRQELTAYYCRAKALVICSFAEGGPNVALEAMACATPVLAPAVGVLKEVLIDGRNGLTVSHRPPDLARAMERLLTEPGLARRLGRQGPATAQRFEAQAIIENYAKGLQAVARQAAG